ncbi:MAG: SDR family NAD(P)-dependent oxidoreductase, partial [Clostridiales bacterium]|nr:SDR family NAD(P)-dependent oxidoreductase [Clostridiales bacterium]
MDFTGKTALITGAAKGIGAACAKRMASLGARLVLTDIDKDALTSLEGELGGEHLYCRCDVANENEVRSITAKAVEKLGGIDILINNAGIFKEGVMPFDRQD